MKHISKSQWERYKQTDGKEMIEHFEKLLSLEMNPEEFLIFAQQINPSYFQNTTDRERNTIINAIGYVLDVADEAIEAVGDNIDDMYNELMRRLGQEPDGNKTLEELEEKDFKLALNLTLPISVALSSIYNGFFIPYLWTMQFYFLKEIAQKYEIELPKAPKKSEYLQRCYYYLDLCGIFGDFAEENNLSRAELCAFLYDYELNLLREELTQESTNEALPAPLQGWFLVGNKSEGEKHMKSGFWQANPETLRGDVMVFYEKSPVMALNAVWRAATDGSKDPLFYYYSSTNICDKIDIPSISFAELQEDSYFKNHPLIRKKFQGGSGWPLTSEDYNNILRILTAKGFDTSVLPKLMAHETPKDLILKNEADVHSQLVMPMLKSMGWTKENGDIAEQVNQHVGRGETQKKGRTDISLHPYGEDLKKARVLIEEKFWMRNEKEIEDAFRQGESYANLSNSELMVTCDKLQIRVYKRDHKGLWDPTTPIIFYWDSLSDPDNYRTLKHLLSLSGNQKIVASKKTSNVPSVTSANTPLTEPANTSKPAPQPVWTKINKRRR